MAETGHGARARGRAGAAPRESRPHRTGRRGGVSSKSAGQGVAMRIGHCQFESKCGDFDANLRRAAEGLERAQRDRVEVVSFPECFLTGYPDTEAEVRKVAFAVDSPQMMKVLDRTSRFEPTVILGFNEKRGGDLYNTCLVA